MRPGTKRRRFIAAESEGLIIEAVESDAAGRDHLRLVKLRGTWRANARNELVFELSGHECKPKSIVLKGRWRLNKNQQIEYSTADGRDNLTFQGYWQLPSAKKLVYIFEGSSTSRFEFKAQLESPNLQPKKGEIRYRIGIGARKSRLGQVIALYGEWKFGRNLGLSFEMPYSGGRVRQVRFGALLRFSPRDELSLDLLTGEGKEMGCRLTFTRRFLKKLNALAFIRLQKMRDAGRIDVGMKIPF
jgi:hypothetical protein